MQVLISKFRHNGGLLRQLSTTVPLNIQQLKPIQQTDGWDKLVLPRGHREIVQAMVENHTQGIKADKEAEVEIDLVQGKGKLS